MRVHQYLAAITVVCVATSSLAQTTTPPATPPPSTLSPASSSSYERGETLPNVNIYLPEGEASLRLRRLIRNALFETQIDYKFVSGDISTFLRYKYYARTYTYRIGIFDTVEFPEIGETSTTEFERVRGGLLLIGVPRDYNRRFLALLQNDRLTFGDLTNVDNKKNNIYTKLGYQFGTQFDERLNSIVGETRGRITPVLTAFRDIGPQKTGFAAALTQSARFATGDYKYTKLEGEVLRRFDLSRRTFIFSRLHVGSFFGYERLDEREDCSRDQNGAAVRPEIECYSVPRYEMFRLGGRDALASIDTNEFTQGLQEVHLRNELFVPIFRNRDYKTWLLHWNTLYGIFYTGAGTVGFDRDQLTKTNDAVVDAGIGFEASLMVRDDFEVLFSMLYSHTVAAPCDDLPDGRCLEGQNWKFSVRTIR
jgi:hypothetical protein